MAWTADDLIASAKRRGAIPTAQVTWQTQDFLSMADEEILGYCVPLINRMREEYYLQQDDFVIPGSPPVGGTFFRIPDRALAGSTRDIMVLDTSGIFMDLPRLTVDDLTMSSWGYYVQGGLIGYVNRSNFNSPVTLRMTYFLRPSALTLKANVAKVAAFDPVAKTITLDGTPSGYAGNYSWDIIKAGPNYEMLTWDEPGVLAAGIISFSGSLPAELAIGDWVALAGITPVPQLPVEMHPLLAQRLAVKFLEAQGESEQLNAAAMVAGRMEKDVETLFSPRMAGEPRKVMPRDGVWRRWRR
jgi:hypothetical protein